MLSIRLSNDLEDQLNKAALRLGITKSELVRHSLTSFIQQQDAHCKQVRGEASAWELEQGLFGNYGHISQ